MIRGYDLGFLSLHFKPLAKKLSQCILFLPFASPLSQTFDIFGTLTQDKSFLPYHRLGEQRCFVGEFYHLVANVM